MTTCIKLLERNLTILLVISCYYCYAQQGLLLSNYKDRNFPSTNYFRLAIDSWYQLLPNDKHSIGGSFTFCPYFQNSQSEFRLKLGVYSNQGDNLRNKESLISYLIIPSGPSLEMAIGYTKLFSHANLSHIAANGDFHYCYRELKDSIGTFSVSTYYFRGGLEIIPIPRLLSIYGNFDLLLGVSGQSSYQGHGNLLKDAQYFDAGIKLSVPIWPEHLLLNPDFNLIFAEKRISDLLPSHDSIIPNFKVSLIFKFPKATP